MTAPTLTVTETFDGRTAVARIGGERNYVRAFWVTSDVVVDQAYAGNATGLPSLGEVYYTPRGGFDARATCREIHVTQRNDSNKEWRVEAHYSTRIEGSLTSPDGQTGGSPSQASQENPLLRPPTRRWGSSRYTRPAVVDVDGGLIRNSAGDPFDPPVMRTEINLTLHVTCNVAAFNPLLIAQFENAVNSTRFLRWGPRQVKCTHLGAEEKYENGLFYVTVSAEFEFKQGTDTWTEGVLDRGYRQLADDPLGNQSALTVTVIDPGVAYQIGDTITLAGGTPAVPTGGTSPVPAILRVTGIRNSVDQGPITAVSIYEPGIVPPLTFVPTATVAQTSDSGTGGTGANFLVTLDSSGGVITAAINVAGDDYIVGDMLDLDIPGVTARPVLRVEDIAPRPYDPAPIFSVAIQGSGFYSALPVPPVAQASSTGSGTGATFQLTWGAGKTPQVIFVGGQKPAQPVLLDGHGVKQADPPAGAPVYLAFQLNREIDFNLLGLI